MSCVLQFEGFRGAMAEGHYVDWPTNPTAGHMKLYFRFQDSGAGELVFIAPLPTLKLDFFLVIFLFQTTTRTA
jgi:hypothetical protein